MYCHSGDLQLSVNTQPMGTGSSVGARNGGGFTSAAALLSGPSYIWILVRQQAPGGCRQKHTGGQRHWRPVQPDKAAQQLHSPCDAAGENGSS